MSENSTHIAVIVSTIDEEYQSGILSGIRQYAFANGITLEIFVAFGNIGSDNKHDIGEYNIFTLANFKRFDGVILLINTIQSADCLEEVLQRVRNSGIPAVCIDRDVKGLYSIKIDNEAAMRAMVEHFIEHHGCTRINYVSGPENNIDSMQRMKAYKTVLREHHIPIELERIYRGQFTSKDGAAAVQKFMNSPLELPEVIVCANDNMAVATVNALMMQGIRVPEDIMVSGFDNTYNARNYAPSMTSVERPLERVGQLACQKIIAHLRGENPERSTTLETRCCFSQSCGCNTSQIMDVDEFKKRNYAVLESFMTDSSLTSRLASSLTDCDNLEDYVHHLKTFIPEFRCQEFYLCLCDSWKQGIMADETEENYLLHILSPQHYITHGYGKNILVPLAYKDGEFIKIPDFPAEEMLPNLFNESNKAGNYYFFPLHFRARCMGYCVIKDSEFPNSSKLFHNCMIDIANSLESVRKIICLDRVTQKLNKLYTIDPLANINNRNGFRIATQIPFTKCIEEKKPVMIMFLDMDGLKYINDNFGHKAGDSAISSMADVLRNACTDGEICCRFGGDEFIIFASDYTEQKAKQLSARIQELLTKANSQKSLPYHLATSLGYHIAVPQEGSNLFQLVTVADNIMYEQKKRRKSSRYLKRTGEEAQ